MAIKNRVKELRLAAGLPQEQVALAVGVEPPAVSKWELQKTNPKPQQMFALAALFGVSISEILVNEAS